MTTNGTESEKRSMQGSTGKMNMSIKNQSCITSAYTANIT